MRRGHLLLLTVLLAGCIFGTGPCQQNGPPPPDQCETPSSTVQLTKLELGRGASDESAPFEPLEEGAIVNRQLGGQGLEMIGLRVRMTGTEADCVAQKLKITGSNDAVLLTHDLPLSTYAETPGVRITHSEWLPFGLPEPGAPIIVTLTIGDQTLVRTLYMDERKPDLSSETVDLAVPDLDGIDLHKVDLAHVDLNGAD